MGLCCLLQKSKTGQWKSLSKICEEKGVLGKMKTEAQQRRYVEKTLKLEVTDDDQGRPGVVFSSEGDDVKAVRMGRRLSHSKIHQKEASNRQELDAMAEKSAASVRCNMASQENALPQRLGDNWASAVECIV